ncbi:helicase-exonuclease AddAB subunit AddA [Pallidibacillus pasinlerensis]|uniref:ATP-dependent helicase/nuclease subunit A n=1 Tax=Pallidibacillus pasinlerensis TaxID=2703818 RepID=A0ABX0A5V1_9BACI|nr:helicase-exonuclease AddAB subunit AddA [Pallidibacillus pasinlerensis]NCU16567.1 helicase-exonuclease AddAB subunit AddA [Pallidibacillus pasinlerensis]
MNIPVKPQDVTWTDDQWKAIHASGKDILVAAAAGSGKTAVLVERIIEKIISETNPMNVDELLVATFTNASAAEMRQRIGVALEKEIAKNPYSNHLRRQLSLLNNATISTLHSFCLEVVRKYYYMIDIDPGFRLMEETEGMLLKDEALESLLEEEYGKKDNEPFFKVVDMFTNDRNDDELQKLILQLFEFSRANPNPERWLESLVDIYDIGDDQKVEDLPFIEPLLYDLELQLNEAKRLFEEALELTRQPGGPDKRAENFEKDIQLVNLLLKAKDESFQILYDAFQNVSFTRLKTCRGDEYLEELVEKSKTLREQGKKIITKLKEDLFSRKPETYLNDLRAMKEPVRTLVNLVRGFSQKFSELKKEKGLVDFSDLEHYALQILGTPNENGELIPTEAALSYQKQFKEVFIDEYQDTNMVQESILQLVKKPSEAEGNLFMVGDVKQSIYRFRLAEPNLFLNKYLRFTLDGEKSGLRIDLSRNFRSRKEVLDGTNFIFKQIMGKAVGEIEYDEAAELKLGADYPQDKPYPVEFTIIHNESAEEDEQTVDDESYSEAGEDFFTQEELEQSELESIYVARKIRELIDSKVEVFDTKKRTYRPIQYRDIVILFRSFKWAPQFMEACKDENIPVYADISTGYFEAAEVSTMLALLQVIDNPYQDIPLVSVLRSPIIGLNEEELAQIRIHAKKTSFFEAVKKFQSLQAKSKFEERIQQKLDMFLHKLNDWRTQARSGALSDLIWQLYRDTKFYDYVGGLPGGKQRQANLRALYDRARQYESTSFRGLFRFLRFIERMQDRGEDLGVARALGENEDVVRIITIHKSKGLEFPVVFVAGMGREFNMMDLRKNYLFDKEYGLATKYINPEKQITYDSLIHMSFNRKKRLELIAEEMRVLYVALTRAKEKLYLVGSTKNKEKLIDKWQKHLSEPTWLLSDFDRMKAKSYLDWVGPALIRHRDADNLRLSEIDTTNETVREVIEHPSLWKIDWVSSLTLNKAAEEENEAENLLNYVKKGEPVPVESEYKEKIASQLQWQYEYETATVHRSKQSVTEIKRLREIKDEYSDMKLVRSFKKPITARPKFMQEKKLTPAEKGTAMHMVMQHVDLSTKPTLESIEKQIFFMQEKELMTEEEAKAIDVEAVVRFFDSKVGLRVLGSDWVRREVPFSFTLPPQEVYPDWQEGDDPVFVQGMIDLLMKDANGLVLIDFKTDQITDRFKGGFEEAKPVLLKRYETQVELYRKAIETIFNEPVTTSYLYFFDGGHILTVE